MLTFRIPGYADLRRIVPIAMIVALLFAAEAWLPSASGRSELSPLLTSAAMVVLLAGISHSRFNAFTEVQGMDEGLRAWKWADRYDPRLQLRALVVKDRANAHAFHVATSSPEDRLAFALAAYNGGVGGTLGHSRSPPSCPARRPPGP